MTDLSATPGTAALHLSAAPPPALEVQPELRKVIATWLAYLADVAGSGEADLHLVSTNSPDGWLDIELRLRQLEPPSQRQASTPREDDMAFDLLDRLGGDFRMNVQYPDVSVHLRLPSVEAQAA
ncbi:MAG: hypothetical protein FJW40_24805 [Acidobacteria bacterium]|nr:hypothetical protein [Acidobacteriota bacterium]